MYCSINLVPGGVFRFRVWARSGFRARRIQNTYSLDYCKTITRVIPAGHGGHGHRICIIIVYMSKIYIFFKNIST